VTRLRGLTAGVHFPAGANASRPNLGPTQNPNERVEEGLIPGVKRVECEVDHSPWSSGKDKNTRSYCSTPPIRLHGKVLS
jgi:hypothetical protein